MASSRLTVGRLDQLLRQAREPVFWLSADLRIVWVNQSWEELTGHPAGSVTGLICRAHGPTKAADLLGLGGSFSPPPEALAGHPASTRTMIVHASGERLWRRVEYWPFHDDLGEVFAILGFVRPMDEPALASESSAHRLRMELMEIRHEMLSRHGLESLIGHGPAHLRLLNQVEAAARSTVPVLITGEAGTGKRLVARTIHLQGERHQSPLLAFDCAALPAEILERELFGGSERTTSHAEEGLTLPEGATLLIGDILDLPRDLQSRLAASLDGKVRLIALTSADPHVAFQSGRLRPDLYHALTTLVIPLRPLRERLEELPLLAQSFLERANQRGGRQRSSFREEAMAVLLGYDWPGNLRELGRVVEHAHAEGAVDAIEVSDLPVAIRGHLGAAYQPPPAPPPASLDELLTQVERRLIENTLIRARHNKSRAADMLGISRPRLYRRIKELGLPDEPEPADDLA